MTEKAEKPQPFHQRSATLVATSSTLQFYITNYALLKLSDMKCCYSRKTINQCCAMILTTFMMPSSRKALIACSVHINAGAGVYPIAQSRKSKGKTAVMMQIRCHLIDKLVLFNLCMGF